MFSSTMLHLFGYLSGILSALCYIPYLIGIYRKEVKPERASWLIWSVLTTMGFFSNLAIGATNSLWLPATQGIGVIIVFLLSVRYGYGGLLKRDILILLAAGITLIIWYFTHQPQIALCLTIAIDCMGALLTLIKSYQEPETETALTWGMSGVAGFFALLSVGVLDPFLMAYPMYIFLINSAVVVAILLGRKRKETLTLPAQVA